MTDLGSPSRQMSEEDVLLELRGLVIHWRTFVSIGNGPDYSAGKEAGKQSCADDLEELIEKMGGKLA